MSAVERLKRCQGYIFLHQQHQDKDESDISLFLLLIHLVDVVISEGIWLFFYSRNLSLINRLFFSSNDSGWSIPWIIVYLYVLWSRDEGNGFISCLSQHKDILVLLGSRSIDSIQYNSWFTYLLFLVNQEYRSSLKDER